MRFGIQTEEYKIRLKDPETLMRAQAGLTYTNLSARKRVLRETAEARRQDAVPARPKGDLNVNGDGHGPAVHTCKIQSLIG